LFHLPVVIDVGTPEVLAAARTAGMRVLATTGDGDRELDELDLDHSLRLPSVWLFGSEAHGLPPEILTAADTRVRIPIHGRAESLNLAAAAAICLYASARAQRR
jgi:TrmH family RNA methyltransferase